ncbi:MAG: amino acid--tRNA ligase-related protein [Candidatus Micrarchaeia archaeon]
MLRSHYIKELGSEMNGHRVTLAGWVHEVRGTAKITFLLLRNRTEIVQVIDKEGATSSYVIKSMSLPKESVVLVKGIVKANPEAKKGFEIIPESIENLNPLSAPVPFEVTGKVPADLDVRLKEISSGAQRIHKADMLEEALRKRSLNPENFAFYINAFRLGAPPHASWSIGLERLTMKITGANNIRECSMFPRDRKRVTRDLMDCIFCKIANNEASAFKIYEDDEYIAILDIFPNIKGQTLVMPKKHISSYAFDASDEELCKLMKVSKIVAKMLEKGLSVKYVHMVLEGTTINHLHAKLYPAIGMKNKNDVYWIKEEVYFNRYEGYITTKMGPKAKKETLEKLKNMIVKKNKQ